jgi:hypothetical protein
MGDDILSFEEHCRQQDKNPSLVRCARCGKLILATASRCPECKVHFQGEAQDFLHPSERPTASRAGWVAVVALVLVAAMVICALTLR